ncbi:uncharacterized protein TNCV_4621701 [Trichonephila clavipes]|nr:uncharacterized protein TNCV_4621701 [Trichonephila clavipes]
MSDIGPFLDIFWTISSTTLAPDQLASTTDDRLNLLPHLRIVRMPSPVQSNCDAHDTIANGQYGAVWSMGHTQQDEVEKLAYQLNEEAERTERPIGRLSKVMYGSTCADMQVDVMGESLSSIKHVVGTTSGCFYPRSNHWEVGGRPQCDKCGCRVRNCSQHRFTTLETISNYRNSYPGFSSGRPRGTTPADDRYIVLKARRNRRQTAGEIARHTTQATGRPISRFTVTRRLHGGGLFARRPVRCVSLTPAHRRRRSLCGAGNTGIERQ